MSAVSLALLAIYAVGSCLYTQAASVGNGSTGNREEAILQSANALETGYQVDHATIPQGIQFVTSDYQQSIPSSHQNANQNLQRRGPDNKRKTFKSFRDSISKTAKDYAKKSQKALRAFTKEPQDDGYDELGSPIRTGVTIPTRDTPRGTEKVLPSSYVKRPRDSSPNTPGREDSPYSDAPPTKKSRREGESDVSGEDPEGNDGGFMSKVGSYLSQSQGDKAARSRKETGDLGLLTKAGNMVSQYMSQGGGGREANALRDGLVTKAGGLIGGYVLKQATGINIPKPNAGHRKEEELTKEDLDLGPEDEEDKDREIEDPSKDPLAKDGLFQCLLDAVVSLKVTGTVIGTVKNAIGQTVNPRWRSFVKSLAGEHYEPGELIKGVPLSPQDLKNGQLLVDFVDKVKPCFEFFTRDEEGKFQLDYRYTTRSAAQLIKLNPAAGLVLEVSKAIKKNVYVVEGESGEDEFSVDSPGLARDLGWAVIKATPMGRAVTRANDARAALTRVAYGLHRQGYL